jgi:3-isopropylmalate dehydrogenase
VSTVAVLPGDGIGKEVTREALRVLRAVRPDVEYVEGVVGGDAIRAGLPPLPQETRALCERSVAILFGAVGAPEFDALPLERRPEHALFALRHDFELYANLRPVRTFAGLEDASPLQRRFVKGLDLLVVRELTGGIYFGKPKERRIAADGIDEAVDTMSYRAPEVERIAKMAFDLARARRKRVASVDKHNILATSGLWRDVVTRIAAGYPDVEVEHLLVDNAAMQLIRRPREFDVILTENMFGDILSDEAAMLTGSIGTLPSASLGARKTTAGRFGMFEPISGTAPDISGKGIANPIAAILSAAMLLRFSLDDEPNAKRVELAVEDAIRSGARTRDLAPPPQSSLSTSVFADRVIARL